MGGTDSCERDVIVVGGGPAGSLTAGLLARAGRSVVLFERDTFPRFHIGESMLPQSLSVLERAGVLGDVEAGAFPRKEGAVFASADGRSEARFDFAESEPASRFPFARQVDRAAFDALLLDWAGRQGVDVRTGVRVTDVRGRSSREGAGVVAGGAPFAARFVVDAAGLDALAPAAAGWSDAPPAKDRVALFAHVRLAVPATDFFRTAVPGDIAIVEQGDRWCWLIPLRDGATSVGFVIPVAEVREPGAADATARWEALVAAMPRVAEVLRGAERRGAVRGVRSYGRALRRMHGDGLVAVGDAAGFVDPVFSSGLCIALASAERLAAELTACLDEPDSEPQRLDAYEAFVREGLRAIRPFVDGWYDGALRRVFYHPAPVPAARRAITSVLAGELWRTDNPFVADGPRRLATLDAAMRLPRPESA